MSDSLEKENKDKIILSFIKKNKLKFFLVSATFFCVVLVFLYINESQKKKNILISEKFIKAGYLLSNNKDEARKIYEEIILSKNNFYSLLALNTVIEKEIIDDKNKILEYFNILEKKNFSQKNIDLILFKKSLYLLKIEDYKSGKKILNNLINKNSNLKFLAEDVVLE